MQGLLSNTADDGGDDLTRVVILGSESCGLNDPQTPMATGQGVQLTFLVIDGTTTEKCRDQLVMDGILEWLHVLWEVRRDSCQE